MSWAFLPAFLSGLYVRVPPGPGCWAPARVVCLWPLPGLYAVADLGGGGAHTARVHPHPLISAEYLFFCILADWLKALRFRRSHGQPCPPPFPNSWNRPWYVRCPLDQGPQPGFYVRGPQPGLYVRGPQPRLYVRALSLGCMLGAPSQGGMLWAPSPGCMLGALSPGCMLGDLSQGCMLGALSLGCMLGAPSQGCMLGDPQPGLYVRGPPARVVC